jgi:hypothetical protein
LAFLEVSFLVSDQTVSMDKYISLNIRLEAGRFHPARANLPAADDRTDSLRCRLVKVVVSNQRIDESQGQMLSTSVATQKISEIPLRPIAMAHDSHRKVRRPKPLIFSTPLG